MEPLYYFGVIGLAAAMNSKALGLSVVYAVGLLAVYPDPDKSFFLFTLYWLGYVLAVVRQ